MPPRQNELKMVAHAASRPNKSTSISPASRPNLFELPKDISFLDIQHPSLPTAADVIRQRMASSLERASQRANEIRERLDREDTKQPDCPVVKEACRSALVNEMSKALVQANLLLEDTKKVDKDVTAMTKNKRLSVSLINALQYLDTLESATAFSSRDRLEAGLLSVLNSIASNHKEDDLLDVNESLDVYVSSWKAPSLAFDFRVGRPALFSLPVIQQEPLSLPLDLEIRPIIEYTAEELIQSPRQRAAEAFSVKVKKCRHIKREYGNRDGITGEAMVQVHIEPLSESKSKKEVVWGVNKDVEPVKVKEVRATQQNAYPTKFRINFDMYSSTVYGQSGLTLTLDLATCQTMEGSVPKVRIELVVNP